jgi:hypothetical protein
MLTTNKDGFLYLRIISVIRNSTIITSVCQDNPEKKLRVYSDTQYALNFKEHIKQNCTEISTQELVRL